jgi:TolA-binding protein
VQPAPPSRAGEERSDSPSPGLQGEAPEPSASALASSTAEAEADPALSWQQLARAGSYREALERAETQGFDSLLAAASAEELRTLADAARLAGSPERARQALVELRRRFPTAEGAALAAFLLGRAAFDEDKAYGAAASWFSIYLAEAPAGPFAREAAGRLLEARSLAGDERGARAAARAYLAAYPDGPHAARARNLLLIP